MTDLNTILVACNSLMDLIKALGKSKTILAIDEYIGNALYTSLGAKMELNAEIKKIKNRNEIETKEYLLRMERDPLKRMEELENLHHIEATLDIIDRINKRREKVKLEEIDYSKIFLMKQYIDQAKNVINSQEELKDAFANLLVASLDDRMIEKLHPSYGDILNQLSYNDVRILKQLYDFRMSLPSVRARVAIGNEVSVSSGHHNVFENVLISTSDLSVQLQNNLSVSNLVRLNLIEFDYSVYYANTAINERVADISEKIDILCPAAQYPDGTNFSMTKTVGVCLATDLGKNFIFTCID